jgi:hypothetical protein
MTKYSKELKKTLDSLDELIAQVEFEQDALQEEQDDYEDEVENWDTGDKEAEEPSDPGNEPRLGELSALLDSLSFAKSTLESI